MPKLKSKIQREAKKGTKIISNTWKFPKTKPIKKLGHVRLYKLKFPQKHL
jgi:hypothetical protein